MSVNWPLPAFWTEIRALLFAAMMIFAYTIGIGILNGADIVDFDQRRLLGHVHGGTLGWLTLSVFAASLWLFGGEHPISSRERTLMRVFAAMAVASFAAYVVAFSTTYGGARPLLGGAAVIAIAGFFGWVAWRSRTCVLAVPHWGFLAALATSVTGGILGVLLGLDIATGRNFMPDDGLDAHPATMVLGFLTPVALAMSEWGFSFPNLPGATRAGLAQMMFLFSGGVVIAVAFVAGLDTLAPVAILLQLVAVGIFLTRMGPSFRRVDWLQAGPERYAVLSGFFVVYVIGLAFYFAIRYEGDFDRVPLNQGLSLDHSQFVGAVTSGIFAMLVAATTDRGRHATLDHIVFVLIEGGLLGFASGLLFDVTLLKQVFAPTMGVGLLLGMGVSAWRLVTLGPEPRGLVGDIAQPERSALELSPRS